MRATLRVIGTVTRFWRIIGNETPWPFGKRLYGRSLKLSVAGAQRQARLPTMDDEHDTILVSRRQPLPVIGLDLRLAICGQEHLVPRHL
nr:hypothetical protein CIT39_27010 [Bradyrhizobium symbiodeficiens]